MIMLNPRHPSVTAAGMSLKLAPAHSTTVISELSQVRQLVRLAEANGVPPHLKSWRDNDLRRLIRVLREQLSWSIRHYIATSKILHQYCPALTCRGLRSDPWAGASARTVAATWAVAVVSTPAIPPEQWRPLYSRGMDSTRSPRTSCRLADLLGRERHVPGFDAPDVRYVRSLNPPLLRTIKVASVVAAHGKAYGCCRLAID